MKTLFTNKWVTIKEKNEYAFIEEPDNVLLIPFKNSQVLLAKEPVLPWSKNYDMDQMFMNVISGTITKPVTPLLTAQKELLEEAGYIKAEKHFHFIKTMRGSKLSRKKYYIYVVDILESDVQVKPIGDGSVAEKKMKVEWVPILDALNRVNSTFSLSALVLAISSQAHRDIS